MAVVRNRRGIIACRVMVGPAPVHSTHLWIHTVSILLCNLRSIFGVIVVVFINLNLNILLVIL
jgi:hypothetical protein